NRREGLSVHSRCSRIGAGQRIGVVQNVLSMDLVVEQIEAEGGLCLRLAIQLPLKAPDLFRRFKAHCQSPDPRPLRQHSRSQGPSLRRGYPVSSVLRPCPTPVPAAAFATCEAATLAKTGLPRCLHHLSTVPCPLPRRIRRVRSSITSPSVRPSPYRWRVGIRIFTFEACSGFTHITARWIARPPKATFVTRLQCDQLPSHPARQLPDLSTTIWVDSSSTGDTRPFGAHSEMRDGARDIRRLRVAPHLASLMRATI